MTDEAKSVDFRVAKQMFTEVRKPLANGGPTVVSLIRNEIFFLPAFLDHYRSLGFTNFIFLDDGSSDGSRELILDQSDSALLTSTHRYGSCFGGQRVDDIWRNLIPKTYCPGAWSLLADVDEFIVLPPRFESVREFLAELDELHCTAVGAVMVDFYPASLSDLDDGRPPPDACELFHRYQFFDGLYHGDWIPGRNRFRRAYGGVRDRLLEAYGIEADGGRRRRDPKLKDRVRNLLGIRKEKKVAFNAIHKVPLVKWLPGYNYVSAHALNAPPSSEVLLPIAHFKFTATLPAKIKYAIESGAYHNMSAEYRAYDKLLRSMETSGGSFLGPNSVRYTHPGDFEKFGLMRAELP